MQFILRSFQRLVMLPLAAVALFLHVNSASAAPVLTPPAVTVCPSYTVIVNFTVTTSGPGPFSYQWQIQTSPGVWNTLGNDPMPLPCGGGAGGFAFASNPFGSQTPLGVHACTNANVYEIRCLVTGPRGSEPSNTATVRLRCPGDANDDSHVNVNDLLAVINAWGACPQPCSTNCAADMNFDCAVNVDDLLAVINHWG